MPTGIQITLGDDQPHDHHHHDGSFFPEDTIDHPQPVAISSDRSPQNRHEEDGEKKKSLCGRISDNKVVLYACPCGSCLASKGPFNNKTSNPFKMARSPDDTWEKWCRKHSLSEASRWLVYLTILLVVTLCVPSLKRTKILNLAPLWEWVLFGILIVGGNAFAYVLRKSVKPMLEWYFGEKKEAVYYIKGLRQAVHFTLFSLLVLFANLFYFAIPDLNHGLNTNAKYGGYPLYKIFAMYLVRTSVAVLVASLLWLLKSYLQLKLKAVQVYGKLEDKIEKNSNDLYFLDIISEQIFLERSMKKNDDDHHHQQVNIEQTVAEHNTSVHHHQHKGLDTLLKKSTRLDQVRAKAKLFIRLARYSGSREEDNTQLFLNTCRENIIMNSDVGSSSREINETQLRKLGLKDEVSKKLYDRLKLQTAESVMITFETFAEWLIKAHTECLQLGFTLTDSLVAIQQLDHVLNAVIIFLAFLSWLLLTKNASTKVLLIIAFPFTTGAFMFQEVGKNMFEGIIFTFFKRPFDVGDRCIIDETRLKVKSLGITMTIFHKAGSREEVKIANSYLATKTILILDDDPEMADRDSFIIYLDMYTSGDQLEKLIHEIKSLLDRYRDRGDLTGRNQVIVKIDDSIKVIIHFKVDIIKKAHYINQSEFLRNEYELRSTLMVDIKKILDNLEIKLDLKR